MNATGGNGKITGYHLVLFSICFLGDAFAGIVSTLMPVYLPVAVKDLLGNKNGDELNYISAWINSVFLYGAALGGLTSGIICDKAGRKAAVIFAISCYGAICNCYRVYAKLVVGYDMPLLQWFWPGSRISCLYHIND